MEEPIQYYHENITNYNLDIVNIKIYSTPQYSANDPSGNMVLFQQLEALFAPIKTTRFDPSMIPNILEKLYELRQVSRVEIINPVNLNGYNVDYIKDREKK